MTKSSSLMLTAIVLLASLAAWQALQLQQMQDTNRALSTQVKTFLSVPLSAKPAGPPGAKPTDAPPSDALVSRAVPVPGQETPEAAAERAARDARFQEMRLLDRAQRADAKILALKTKLNLTPEQETAVRAAMAKASATRDALRTAGDARRRAGGPPEDEKTRQQEMAKFAATETDQETAIAAGLTEEQAAAYTDYKAELKQTQVESRANQQLNDLQNKLSLTAEQKDAAFQFYAQQEQNGFDPGAIAAQGGDVQKAFEERLQTTLAGMKTILTLEQYELYSKQEQERATLFRNAGGPGGMPFFGPRP